MTAAVRARFLFARREIRGADAPLASATKDGVSLRGDSETAVWNPGDDISLYKLVEPGDFVIGLRSFQHGIARSDVRGLVSPAYTVLRTTSRQVHGPYFAHYFRSRPLIASLDNLSQGIRQGRAIPYEGFADLRFPLPELEEQRRIADFLDDRIAHLDRAIALRDRQKILELNRFNAALSEAFSKPDHQQPLKRSAWWVEGPGIMASDFRETGVPVIRLAGVKNETVTLNGCNYVDATQARSQWAHLAMRAGELLISGSGGVRFPVVVPESVDKCIPYTGLIRIASRGAVTRSYLRYFLGSPWFSEQINVLKTGVGIQHWGPTHLAKVTMPVVDPASQTATVERLAAVESRFRLITEALGRHQALLEERKQALITAAVTGQFDVTTARAVAS